MVCGCKKKKIIRWLQLAEHLFSRLPVAGRRNAWACQGFPYLWCYGISEKGRIPLKYASFSYQVRITLHCYSARGSNVPGALPLL